MRNIKTINYLKILICMILCLILLTGCTSTSLDKKNKISENEILNHVEKKLSEKYSKKITGELLEESDLSYDVGFSFLGIPTGVEKHPVKNGKQYKFLMKDSEGLTFIANYSDAYYVRGDENKYIESEFTDDYQDILKSKEDSDKFKETVFYYLDENDDIIKYDYKSYHYEDNTKTLKMPKTTVYLNYSTDEVSREMLAKIFKVYYGYRTDRYNKQITFKDAYYLFDNFEDIFNNCYKANDYDEDINEEKQTIYNEFCEFLENNTSLTKESIKTLATDFFRVAQYFITDDNYKFDKVISNDLLNSVKVICETKSGEIYEVYAKVTFDEEKSEYKIETINISEQKSPISRMPVFCLYKSESEM